MANKLALRFTRTMIRPFRSVLRPLFPQWLVNYFYHLPIAFLAARMYGNPGNDLEIIGVTGTDGKTTTSLLIYHILKTARKKVAVITTIDARIGRKKIKTGFHVTSPNSWKLQKLLRQIRSQKCRYVVLETTSHGLDQFRLYPLRPAVAVLTNITHEHLDYHKTFKKYLQAKLKLFRHAKHAVINKDLDIFDQLNSSLPKVHFSTFSLTSNSQLKPSEVKFLKSSTKFMLGNIEYLTTLTGRYNLYNTLAAISSCLIIGISPSDIKRALATFPPVKGRLEPIENKHGVHAFVDFAHTPNALIEVLSNLSSQKAPGEKLIVVFGAAGLRDKSKRPLMGTAASEFADSVILTSEDPRTEDAQTIAKEILSGVPESKRANVEIEINRGKAIIKAVEIARRGDWVVVCGKGHEETMCFGYTEYPWSDQETLTQALKEKSSE